MFPANKVESLHNDGKKKKFFLTSGNFVCEISLMKVTNKKKLISSTVSRLFSFVVRTSSCVSSHLTGSDVGTKFSRDVSQIWTMGRGVPFSGKKKKQQLRDKKKKRKEKEEESEEKKTSEKKIEESSEEDTDQENEDESSSEDSMPTSIAAFPDGSGTVFPELKDLRTVFEKESTEEVDKRKADSSRPLDITKRNKVWSQLFALSRFSYLKPWEFLQEYISEEPLDIPKRPKYEGNETSTELEEIEHKEFAKWLKHIYSHPRERLNYFEHNIEV